MIYEMKNFLYQFEEFVSPRSVKTVFNHCQFYICMFKLKMYYFISFDNADKYGEWFSKR